MARARQASRNRSLLKCRGERWGWCSPVVAQQEILGDGIIDVGAELRKVDFGQPARSGAGLRPGDNPLPTSDQAQRVRTHLAQLIRGQPVDELVHRFVVVRCGHGRSLLAGTVQWTTAPGGSAGRSTSHSTADPDPSPQHGRPIDRTRAVRDPQ